jgi:ABC-2 type transport system permease protein
MTAAELTGAQPVGPSAASRAFGLGSVFGKSLRDSRWSILGFGVVLALLMVLTASQVAAEFGDAASRAALAAQMALLPDVMRGLLGEPVAIETLGGFLSWRTLGFMPIIVGVWSLIALSSTLSAEAERGSMEFVVAAPMRRRTIALQKAGAHVVALAIAMAILGLGTWLSTVAFATLPGDEATLGASMATAAWIGITALGGGAVAFALAPIIGRGLALTVGGVVLFGSYLVNSYASISPAFETLQPVSYFAWTADHRPLAGISDWGTTLLVAALAVGLIAVGVVAFERRDVGITTSLPIRGPRIGLGLRTPFGRSFAERLPAALAWGCGIGLYGLAIASSGSAFAEALEGIPQMGEIIERFYPGVDLASPGGMLQLAFMGFALLMMGFAAAVLVSGWASDEGERRLELVLSAPVTRFRWALASGAGVMVAVALTAVLLSALIAVGAAADGAEPVQPFVGSLVAGAFGAALGGIGIAVGGLARPGLAAASVIGLTIGFYLLDFLGAALDLPEAIRWLSLSNHLGQPLIGVWDVPGMVACAVLAIGGVLVGAGGMARRDIAG